MNNNKYSSWFVAIVGVFVSALIIANIIAVKPIALLGVFLPAGTIVFPVSYICGDVLTEVYGYRQARMVIWLGFACNLFAVVAIIAAQVLPGAYFWDAQESYTRILGFAPRLLIASFCAYLIGEFANSFVLAKLKVFTQGKMLWLRTIGSTLVGQALDSAVFLTIAFVGSTAARDLLGAIVTQWLFKTVYEAIATPVTYQVVNYLKAKEGIDIFDQGLSLNNLL